MDQKNRCFGNKPNQDFYAHYHDTEWGVPCHDDQKLFELLILEGAQAGLSWETILKRRDGYRTAFHNFDPQKVAAMSDATLQELMNDQSIIRNKFKIMSVRQNAHVYLQIQKEFGSFNTYVWNFVHNKPIVNHPKSLSDLPNKTAISDALSKDLKKRGMNFVGSTIMYAFMQAVGMVDDHIVGCWRKKL